MNKARRKEIARSIAELTNIKQSLSEIHEKESMALTNLQGSYNEEDEEKVAALEELLQNLKEAIDSVEECLDTLENADF